MSDEEVRAICKTIDELKQNGQVILKDDASNNMLEKAGINLEELRKIQDKHYEVDIEYELTRDLYEKQRVIDGYLEEHQEDN